MNCCCFSLCAKPVFSCICRRAEYMLWQNQEFVCQRRHVQMKLIKVCFRWGFFLYLRFFLLPSSCPSFISLYFISSLSFTCISFMLFSVHGHFSYFQGSTSKLHSWVNFYIGERKLQQIFALPFALTAKEKIHDNACITLQKRKQILRD